MDLTRFPRVALTDGPTPIRSLDRLSTHLGPELNGVRLFVKRDDVGPVGLGGNKLRKLEFLIGEAIEQGCDTFITTGGLQSNHARQSAAAAARAGLTCELMLADVVPIHDPDYRSSGNLLLDDILGALVHRLPVGEDALAAAQVRARELRLAGHKPYVVGSGGSSPRGALGYAACAAEIVDQERELGVRFEAIVVPNGSSGTQAGLIAGLAEVDPGDHRIRSYTVLAPLEDARMTTVKLAAETTALVAPGHKLSADTVVIDGSQRGKGYGLPTEGMVDALRLLARSEGLLLDPVYSGKAFAGYLHMASSGAWRGHDALFIMTGGTPGLYAYRETLRS
jgi:L-cysteate sulfo-lyase